MELVLNFAWALFSGLMFCMWLRSAPRVGASRQMQFVALAVFLLILFPVISVTDDLQATLNPAEADSSLRRDHASSAPHSILPAVAGLPMPPLAEPFFGLVRIAASGRVSLLLFDHPSLALVQNRPPPAA